MDKLGEKQRMIHNLQKQFGRNLNENELGFIEESLNGNLKDSVYKSRISERKAIQILLEMPR